MNKKVIVNDSFQRDYTYYRNVGIGKSFHPEFKPQLTPKQMLELGVFGGKYINDCKDEFPKSWYQSAKLSALKKDPSLNYFNADASQSLAIWQNKGWIYHEDPRGWFQWYCRYYMGRRIEKEDLRQVKRWKGITRHWFAVSKNCECYDFTCRRKQRQALLHWAYDSRNI